MDQNLLAIASNYAGKAVFWDSLQKKLRQIHSDCDYDESCFKKEAEEYIEGKVCQRGAFQDYGFVSLKECDRASLALADAVSGGALNSGQASLSKEAEKALEDLNEAEDDLDDARGDFDEAEEDLKDAEDDLRRAGRDGENYAQIRKDYDEAYDSYRDAARKESRAYSSYRRAFSKYRRAIQ